MASLFSSPQTLKPGFSASSKPLPPLPPGARSSNGNKGAASEVAGENALRPSPLPPLPPEARSSNGSKGAVPGIAGENAGRPSPLPSLLAEARSSNGSKGAAPEVAGEKALRSSPLPSLLAEARSSNGSKGAAPGIDRENASRLSPIPQSQAENLAEKRKREVAHNQAVLSVMSKYGPLIIEAENQKNPPLLIKHLISMGRQILELNEWSRAAIYLNCALAECGKSHEDLRSEILGCMAEVEQRLLETEDPPAKRRAADVPDRYFARREQLKGLRKEMEKDLEDKTPNRKLPIQILKEFFLKMNGFIGDLLSDIYEEIGPPPCKFTFLGLGSLARKEMSPYSDL